MIKAYYLTENRFRIRGLDGDSRRIVGSVWKAAGGVVADGPGGSVDLVEGSPARFELLAKTLADEDMTLPVARAMQARLDGVARDRWTLPLARGGSLEVGSRPLIMGIVNVTPDSFSDGGRFYSTESAIEQGGRLAEEGADILDIGGESTRPGSEPVHVDEECRRVLPVIEGLAKSVDVPISIDTRKPEVARRAIDAGAAFINDATMLTYDADLARVAAERGCALALNHILGTPGDMQKDPRYADLWPDIIDALEAAADKAMERGVPEDAIILDPGIGFGKQVHHNLAILKGIHALKARGRPVLIGPSRKRFIDHILHLPVDERLEGSMAACVASLLSGAIMFRVHDVKPHRRALDLTWEIRQSDPVVVSDES